VKNITVTVDDETYRRARVKAAERDTSVSAEVKKFLQTYAAGEGEFERLARRERELLETTAKFSAKTLLSRDELHERKR
jgi:plasmid stability protein